MNSQQLENFLKDLDIIKKDPTQNGSILLHGTGNKDASAVEDCFKYGLYKDPFSSVLSTIYLNNDNVTNIDTKKMVSYDYGCDENNIVRTLIVHFPKTLGNLYLGNVYINEGEHNDNRGLQNTDHCLLDLVLRDKIPTEFIVGVIERNQNEEDNFEFKMNPNYFGTNSESEIKITKEITDKVSKHITASLLTGPDTDEAKLNLHITSFKDMFNTGEFYNFAKDMIAHQYPSKINDPNFLECFEASENYTPQTQLNEQSNENENSDIDIESELEKLQSLFGSPNTEYHDNDIDNFEID